MQNYEPLNVTLSSYSFERLPSLVDPFSYSHLNVQSTQQRVLFRNTANMRFSAMSFFPLGLVCLAQVVIGLATRHENLIRQQELDINSNLTDAQIISTLSTSGRCPYYLTTGEAFSDMSLAACELWCPSIYGDLSGDWNVGILLASHKYNQEYYNHTIANMSCVHLANISLK